MSEVGICRTCDKTMSKPYWRKGGGWYCGERCKAEAPKKSAALKAVRRHRRSKDGPRYRLPEYQAYINSAAWKKRRKRALVLANYTCHDCGLHRTTGLHVHHLTYSRFGKEWDTDLRVLCSECHEETHRLKKSETRSLWKGQRYCVCVAKRESGWFKVIDMKRDGRELTRLRDLRSANRFAKGADAARGAFG